MHNVLPNSRAFPHRLGRHCRASASISAHRAVAEQIVRRRHRVLRRRGARRRAATTCSSRARRGVVLATGDYSGDRELKAKLASETAAKTSAVNAPTPATVTDWRSRSAPASSTATSCTGRGCASCRRRKPSLIRRLPPIALIAHRRKICGRETARCAAAPIPDELRDDRPRRGSQPLQARRHPGECARVERFADELGAPQDALPDQPESGRLRHPGRHHRRDLLALAELRLDCARGRLRLHRRLPPQPPRHLPRSADAGSCWPPGSACRHSHARRQTPRCQRQADAAALHRARSHQALRCPHRRRPCA